MTSPTVHADFLYARVGVRPDSFIAYRMRRCTGLSPSRTSGSARDDDDAHRVLEERVPQLASGSRSGALSSRLCRSSRSRLPLRALLAVADVLNDHPHAARHEPEAEDQQHRSAERARRPRCGGPSRSRRRPTITSTSPIDAQHRSRRRSRPSSSASSRRGSSAASPISSASTRASSARARRLSAARARLAAAASCACRLGLRRRLPSGLRGCSGDDRLARWRPPAAASAASSARPRLRSSQLLELVPLPRWRLERRFASRRCGGLEVEVLVAHHARLAPPFPAASRCPGTGRPSRAAG